MKKFKLASLAFTAFTSLAIAILAATNVFAAQIDYTNPNNEPIKTPKFNTYTNAPAGIGNEADFVKLRKSNGDSTVPASVSNFVDPVNDPCAVGTKFDIRTYVHNGANVEFNNNGSGSAVAKNVNVAMQAPLGVTSNKFTFKSTISASNAASVTDTGTLNCGDNVQLKLVPKTVNVYSRHTGWNADTDGAVNGNLKIGSRVQGSGDVWGCWDDRIMVVYTVEVVKPEEPKPVYTCDVLMAKPIGDRKYSFTLRVTAKDGAVFKNASYNFGDGTTANDQGLNVDHQYKEDGEYTVVATPTFTVDGKDVQAVENPKCQVVIKTSVPKENCPIPGKEHLPKDSPECKEDVPVTPVVTTLPATGAGGILAGIFGTGATAYGVNAYLQSRRALKNIK